MFFDEIDSNLDNENSFIFGKILNMISQKS